MRNKRMFSLQIVDTDAFLDMPHSSQLLYFHLSMRADDDGFVSNPKKIMRTIGSQEDDYKVLLAKRFIIPFESGVCVIKHWRINNYIRSDRYVETVYEDEKKQLTLKENGSYTEGGEPVGIPDDNQSGTENRIEEKSIEENREESGEKSPRDAEDKFTEEDIRLATLLRDLIRESVPTFKEPNLKKWADHVRLMRERDDRTPEQIEFLIKWAQNDSFWQANILSTKKLREKFDTLVAHAKRDMSKNNIPIAT